MGIDADIAKNMSMALVGELPLGADVFGAMIIDAIFPSPEEVPGYFQEVYAQITRIVQQVITQNEIDLIEAEVIGIQNWITTTYSTIREDKSRGPLERFMAVAPYEAEFNTKVMGTLMQGTYALPGFPMFLTAASMHLALKQELAFNDYRHLDNPVMSPYAGAVQHTARLYADFAVATWASLQAARRSAVKGTVRHSTQLTPVPRGDPVKRDIWSYNWRDEGANPVVEGTKHSEGHNDWTCSSGRQSAAEAEAYREQIIAKLDADLGNVATIVEDWMKLFEWPLRKPFQAKLLFAKARVVGERDGATLYQASWATENATKVLMGHTVYPASGEAEFSGVLPVLTVIDHFKGRRVFPWHQE